MSRISQKIFLLLAFIVVVVVGVFVISVIRRPQLQLPSVIPPTQVLPKTIGIIQWLKFLDPAVEGFKKGMVELGYVEGKDVIYEYDFVDANAQKGYDTAKRYADQNFNLIYTVTGGAAEAGLKATTDAGKITLPIVFAHADAPVERGLIKDYKSSGTHLTGVAVDLASTTAKKLEILQKINPKIKKIGVFVATNTNLAEQISLAALKEHTVRFGMTIVEYRIENPPGPESIAEAQQIADRIKPGEIDALIHNPGSTIAQQSIQQTVAVLGKRLKIPAVLVTPDAVKAGALFTYAHDLYAIGEQAAVIADKIFNGTRPADIPIEFPKKNIFVLNMKTANEIGITIPDSLLELVDVKIE